ncbi:hypothetical protein LIER_23074 [Lithospermum erythrorhizon]|uniref:Uncharacterized protein n=1 Tax=Lithospermum erythrorhizon TaxID=34254 RepID=A0AAV3QXM9_LITER
MVAEGYTQVEGVDFDGTFAHLARLEAIRLLLGLYAKNVVKKFGLEKANPKRTPRATDIKIGNNEDGILVDQSLSGV